MESNFQRSLTAVLKHEGGYVDHPSDPGGATNLGITHKTLASWRKVSPWWSLPKSEIKALTISEAGEIYKDKYWDTIRGDDLPSGVDYAVMDFAVNSGPARAAIYLQEIVGVAPDGKIGPLTLQAVAKWDSVALIEALCAKRMGFLKRLSTWPTFGKGWSARVTGVLRLAKDMAITMPSNPIQPSKPVPQATAPKPRKSPLAPLVAVLIAMVAAAYAFLKSNGILP